MISYAFFFSLYVLILLSRPFFVEMELLANLTKLSTNPTDQAMLYVYVRLLKTMYA